MADNQDKRNAEAQGAQPRQTGTGGDRQQSNSGNYRNRRGRYKPYQGGNKPQRDGGAQSADGTQQRPRRNDNYRNGQGNRGNRPNNQNSPQRRAEYAVIEKPLDTAEDIAKDTERLEKEIMLEISEIKALSDSL